MEEKIKRLKNSATPSKSAAKRTLDEFSRQVVTQNNSDRLFLNNLLSNFFMSNKNMYYGIAAIAVVLVLTFVAFSRGVNNSQTARNVNNGPKTQYAVATEEIEKVSSDLDETIAELDSLDQELADLEASISLDDIDALMKDLDSIK